MYYLSGATLRFIGEGFNPERFRHVEGVEIGQITSTNLAGRTALRGICRLDAPESFAGLHRFLKSKERALANAGFSPNVEIADLLISIRVPPLTGARFVFSEGFFQILKSIHSTLSIHFNNLGFTATDDPSEHWSLEEGSHQDYGPIIKKAYKDPGEADVKLREFLSHTVVKKKSIPVLLLLPSLSARSSQTARFNLSHGCIEALAERRLSIQLDVVGATMGKPLVVAAKARLDRNPKCHPC